MLCSTKLRSCRVDKGQLFTITLVATGSFVAGIIVNDIYVNRAMNKHLNAESILYLAAMDYVKSIAKE